MAIDNTFPKVYGSIMAIKPLDIRTVRNLPKLQRVLAAYEKGERVDGIAERENTNPKMVYYWLARARELRKGGQL